MSGRPHTLRAVLSSPSGYQVAVPEWLQAYELPYLRLPSRQAYPRIEVAAGSMRVGKTTAVEVLASGLSHHQVPVTLSPEDWQHNPYLQGSYLESDPSLALLNSQKYFAQRKFEQLSQSYDSVLIQDVPPEMDFCYALTNAVLGRLSPAHFAEYYAFYQALDWPSVPFPDVLLVLEASEDILVNRARQAAREFEVIDQHYFLTMNAVNMAWLQGLPNKSACVYVDTDHVNFARDESSKQALVQTVMDRLKLAPNRVITKT